MFAPLFTDRVVSSNPPNYTIESIPTGEQPKPFVNGREIWHIFSLVLFSQQIHDPLQMGVYLERETKKLSSDARFNADDKVATEIHVLL